MDLKVNKDKISKFFDLPQLGQTARQEYLKPEDLLHTNTIEMVSRAFIFGIEVEVENVPHPVIVAEQRRYWDITADNSLRNHGVEYVSTPLKATQIEYALDQLAASLPTDHQFSPRTSVHVHMNVRDLHIGQITALVILYTAVENLLFRWVGHNRDKNVFCIKLTDTDYVRNFMGISNETQSTIHYWNKYTALNLNPMESKGTVEFRHMHGTIDKKKLLTWVNILSCLKMYAKDANFAHLLERIYSLNSNSEYEQFLYEVLGKYTAELVWDDTDKLMADAISYVKLATIYAEPNQKQTAERHYDTPQPVAAHPTLRGDAVYTIATAQNILNETRRLDIPHDIFDEIGADMENTATEGPTPTIEVQPEQPTWTAIVDEARIGIRNEPDITIGTIINNARAARGLPPQATRTTARPTAPGQFGYINYLNNRHQQNRNN